MPEGALKAERYRAHRAVQELLDGLAVGRPLLLALDDLHWADQASLEVVASLLRRPPDGPVLLACAFRPVAGARRSWSRRSRSPSARAAPSGSTSGR